MTAKIRSADANKGSRVQVPETVNYDTYPPLFSLSKIQNSNYCLSKLDQEHKAHFADAIYKRRALSWSQIKSLGRHGLGFEKISRKAIKAPIPNFITDDVDHFLAFRYHSMHPMVGYRHRDIFYVLWFDHKSTLYKH